MTFTARGIHCSSSDAPELAMELFNLVRATPRAAIGQLESTRRATFLGARFQVCFWLVVNIQATPRGDDTGIATQHEPC